MRSVSRATCTSGLPVSPFFWAKSLMTAVLRSFAMTMVLPPFVSMTPHPQSAAGVAGGRGSGLMTGPNGPGTPHPGPPAQVVTRRISDKTEPLWIRSGPWTAPGAIRGPHRTRSLSSPQKSLRGQHVLGDARGQGGQGREFFLGPQALEELDLER